jgi:hypothetical protein
VGFSETRAPLTGLPPAENNLRESGLSIALADGKISLESPGIAAFWARKPVFSGKSAWGLLLVAYGI